jgi:FXSXX-COOH protein
VIVSPGPAEPPAEPPPSALVDVTGMLLPDLIAGDDSVLANSIRRLRAELADNEEIVAGHSEAVTAQQPPNSDDRPR